LTSTLTSRCPSCTSTVVRALVRMVHEQVLDQDLRLPHDLAGLLERHWLRGRQNIPQRVRVARR
jgi:ribosomal protein L31E